MALCVQIYLTMDRVDLAKDELQRMQTTDEDCTLTQLSLARFNMYLGGDASGVARDIVCELMDKYRLVLENTIIFHQRRYVRFKSPLEDFFGPIHGFNYPWQST